MLRRLGVFAAMLVLAVGCGLSRRFAELRAVEFSLDRVADLQVAGLELSRVRSFDGLTPGQVDTIAVAARAGDVPVAFNLIVRARNPSINSASAEVYALDWTLLLNERETVRGRFDRRTQLRPGQVLELPVPVRLNLAQFFGRDPDALIDVLKATIGAGGMPLNLALQTVPTVGSPYGPVGSRAPITITRRVGPSAY